VSTLKKQNKEVSRTLLNIQV